MARRRATSTGAVFAFAGSAEQQPCLRLCRRSDVLAHRRNQNPRLDWPFTCVQNRATLIAHSLARHRLPCGATHQQKAGVPGSGRGSATFIESDDTITMRMGWALRTHGPLHAFTRRSKLSKLSPTLRDLQGDAPTPLPASPYGSANLVLDRIQASAASPPGLRFQRPPQQDQDITCQPN